MLPPRAVQVMDHGVRLGGKKVIQLLMLWWE